MLKTELNAMDAAVRKFRCDWIRGVVYTELSEVLGVENDVVEAIMCGDVSKLDNLAEQVDKVQYYYGYE